MKDNNTLWKPVVGYEGLYEVSPNGDVRNAKTQKVLSKRFTRGYVVLSLWKEQSRKNIPVHRIVALSFLSNPNNKPCVNHLDGDKKNNNITNLEWCTHKENSQHAWLNGLSIVSENQKKKAALAQQKTTVDLYTGIFYDSLKEGCHRTNSNYKSEHTRILRKSKNQRFKYV